MDMYVLYNKINDELEFAGATKRPGKVSDMITRSIRAKRMAFGTTSIPCPDQIRALRSFMKEHQSVDELNEQLICGEIRVVDESEIDALCYKDGFLESAGPVADACKRFICDAIEQSKAKRLIEMNAEI